MTDTVTKYIAEEIAMVLHCGVAGPLLDKGWPMETVIAAIKRCTDLLPELEGEPEPDA